MQRIFDPIKKDNKYLLNDMNIKILFPGLLLFFLLISCTNYSNEQQPPDKVAKQYCSVCHLFPDPSLLDTATWVEYVLPAMGEQLGLKYFGGQPYENIAVNRSNPNNISVNKVS